MGFILMAINMTVRDELCVLVTDGSFVPFICPKLGNLIKNVLKCSRSKGC
jgi:hypothetical protein